MRSGFLFFGFAVLILVGCAEEKQTLDMSNDRIEIQPWLNLTALLLTTQSHPILTWV